MDRSHYKTLISIELNANKGYDWWCQERLTGDPCISYMMELVHAMDFPRAVWLELVKPPHKLLIGVGGYLLIQVHQFMRFIVVCLVKLWIDFLLQSVKLLRFGITIDFVYYALFIISWVYAKKMIWIPGTHKRLILIVEYNLYACVLPLLMGFDGWREIHLGDTLAVAYDLPRDFGVHDGFPASISCNLLMTYTS
jgi:hypothetical protein